MSPPIPDLLVAGPPEHGVVRYARELASATIDAITAGAGCASPQLLKPALVLKPAQVLESAQDARPGHPLHVHFTDRLFGGSPEEAATIFERIAALSPLSVTLHDVPQPSDGSVNLPRRRDCYRRVLESARGVVCNSVHELTLLRELEIVSASSRLTVIPLPAPASAFEPADSHYFDSVAALIGFVYPGKGHREVIDAVARLGGGLEVVALGAASAGHERDVDSLVAHAESVGVTFGASGYLSDDELRARCRRAAVPIAAHRHLSASGSMLTWLSAGRLPLVVESRYSREMLALRPGTMTLFVEHRIDAAIAHALADPRSTIRPAHLDTAPHISDVVESYLAWWADLPW